MQRGRQRWAGCFRFSCLGSNCRLLFCLLCWEQRSVGPRLSVMQHSCHLDVCPCNLQMTAVSSSEEQQP